MNKIHFCIALLCSPFFVNAQQPKYAPAVEQKISQVEHSLCSEIEVEDEPKWTLAERMQFYHVNGVSIAVIKDFKIAWARGFGWADSIEQRPVTTSTLFQAASISKSLNATGLLKLAQNKKLDLFEDINTYLRTWKFPYDSLSQGKKISVANLLSHTAGVTVHGFAGYEKGSSLPSLVQILDGVAPANSPAVRFAFAPSLKADYSGGGTVISQVILQDITRISYDQYLWKNVLEPIGMLNSSFTPPTSKQIATGYLNNGEEIKGKFHIYPEQAPAGLWTNPTDLAKFIIETQLSLMGKSNKVLSQAMTSLALTPYKNRSLGLGFFIDTIGGHVYFSHSGRNAGFVSRYFGSEDGGNGVVVMANTNDIAIVNEIINSVSIVYEWKDFYKPLITLMKRNLPDTLLDSYVGQYTITAESEGQFDLTAGTLFTITKEGHQLKAQAEGEKAMAIYPESDSVFFPRTSDTDIKFYRNDSGIVTRLTVHQNGKFIECKRVK